MKLGAVVLIIILAGCASVTDPVVPSGPEANETLGQKLDTVWGIDFLPDGTLVFTERPGRVSVIENGTVRVVGEIDVSARQESGLFGIAVDPEFDAEPYLYVVYTAEDSNRVSRFPYDGQLGEEEVLLEGIPSALFHDGGAISFGPDGLLYVTTGDATDPSTAQDTSSLAGKILRMTSQGDVPEGNPFDNYVYSYGHRNPQGLAWIGDQLYAVEHGPTRHDEVNRIEAGGNYGWPNSCADQPEGTIEPIRCFDEFTMAPGGLASLDGNLYVSGLRGGQIRMLEVENGSIMNETVLIEGDRFRALASRNGMIYYGTSNRDGRGSPSAQEDVIATIEG